MKEASRIEPQQSEESNWPDSSLAGLPVCHLQLEPAVILSLALRDVHNIGDVIRFSQSLNAAKYDHNEEITSALARLFTAVENGKTNWRAFWRSCRDRTYPHFFHLCATCEELDRLSDASLALPVTRETFGNAGAMLARAGIITIGDLRLRLREGIEYVPGLGQKKVDEFFDRLSDLVSVIDEDGNIDLGKSSDDRCFN